MTGNAPGQIKSTPGLRSLTSNASAPIAPGDLLWLTFLMQMTTEVSALQCGLELRSLLSLYFAAAIGYAD